jgi:hypothetical protein
MGRFTDRFSFAANTIGNANDLISTANTLHSIGTNLIEYHHNAMASEHTGFMGEKLISATPNTVAPEIQRA